MHFNIHPPKVPKTAKHFPKGFCFVFIFKILSLFYFGVYLYEVYFIFYICIINIVVLVVGGISYVIQLYIHFYALLFSNSFSHLGYSRILSKGKFLFIAINMVKALIYNKSPHLLCLILIFLMILGESVICSQKVFVSTVPTFFSTRDGFQWKTVFPQSRVGR